MIIVITGGMMIIVITGGMMMMIIMITGGIMIMIIMITGGTQDEQLHNKRAPAEQRLQCDAVSEEE